MIMMNSNNRWCEEQSTNTEIKTVLHGQQQVQLATVSATRSFVSADERTLCNDKTDSQHSEREFPDCEDNWAGH